MPYEIAIGQLYEDDDYVVYFADGGAEIDAGKSMGQMLVFMANAGWDFKNAMKHTLTNPVKPNAIEIRMGGYRPQIPITLFIWQREKTS